MLLGLTNVHLKGVISAKVEGPSKGEWSTWVKSVGQILMCPTKCMKIRKGRKGFGTFFGK